MSITKEEMGKLKNKITAECNNCVWKGSKYRLLITIDSYHCPVCNSIDVIVHDKAKTK